jgi:hypothetical protein
MSKTSKMGKTSKTGNTSKTKRKISIISPVNMFDWYLSSLKSSQ